MKPILINSRYTEYVQLDTRKCEACWKCLEKCVKNVIGKVNMPWHKHAKFVKPEACTGCLKCINICEYTAFSKIDKANQ